MKDVTLVILNYGFTSGIESQKENIVCGSWPRLIIACYISKRKAGNQYVCIDGMYVMYVLTACHNQKIGEGHNTLSKYDSGSRLNGTVTLSMQSGILELLAPFHKNLTQIVIVYLLSCSI